MSTIPVVEARFFDPKEDRVELETRLMRHLRKLRCKRSPPLLLDGPPGIGKSLALILAKLPSTTTTVIEATGENASFAIVGSQHGWGGSPTLLDFLGAIALVRHPAPR